MQYLCVPCAASWLKVSNLCPHCRALGHYTDAEQTSRLMIHVNRGNANAYYRLYTWLLVGQPDLPQDLRRAVVCLRIAAAKGHTKAKLWSEGVDVEGDQEEREIEYQLALESQNYLDCIMFWEWHDAMEEMRNEPEGLNRRTQQVDAVWLNAAALYKLDLANAEEAAELNASLVELNHLSNNTITYIDLTQTR
ncbi:hypothetical protein M885DRAFT_576651 [Pelagophyceae sp. CCMP2097]|nr:hypothetical protein M885DRAFT_576651 [Pelagophyceae sp. CCMP2097]